MSEPQQTDAGEHQDLHRARRRRNRKDDTSHTEIRVPESQVSGASPPKSNNENSFTVQPSHRHDVPPDALEDSAGGTGLRPGLGEEIPRPRAGKGRCANSIDRSYRSVLQCYFFTVLSFGGRNRDASKLSAITMGSAVGPPAPASPSLPRDAVDSALRPQDDGAGVASSTSPAAPEDTSTHSSVLLPPAASTQHPAAAEDPSTRPSTGHPPAAPPSTTARVPASVAAILAKGPSVPPRIVCLAAWPLAWKQLRTCRSPSPDRPAPRTRARRRRAGGGEAGRGGHRRRRRPGAPARAAARPRRGRPRLCISALPAPLYPTDFLSAAAADGRRRRPPRAGCGPGAPALLPLPPSACRAGGPGRVSDLEAGRP